MTPDFDEREFLHRIANDIAGAKMSLEVLVEMSNETVGSPAHSLLHAALASVTKLATHVEERRATLKKE